MTTIHKYLLNTAIELPEAATFLSAEMTPEGPALWFLVATEAPKETRRFIAAATGMPLPSQINDCPFIGTVTWVCPTGKPEQPLKQRVAHIFEIPAGLTLPPPEGATASDPADWWKK